MSTAFKRQPCRADIRTVPRADVTDFYQRIDRDRAERHAARIAREQRERQARDEAAQRSIARGKWPWLVRLLLGWWDVIAEAVGRGR